MIPSSEAPPFEYLSPPPSYYHQPLPFPLPPLPLPPYYPPPSPYQPTYYLYPFLPSPLPLPLPNDLASHLSHLTLSTEMTAEFPTNETQAPENPPPPPPPPPPTQRLRGKKGSVWLPGSGTSHGQSSRKEKQVHLKVLSSLSMEFDESHSEAEIRTTVMIKNIPNQFSREMLFELLDQHCAMENEKAVMENSPLSGYDFVYLPMDFVQGCNLGYAFVNFTTATAAWRLYCAMHRRKWVVFDSRKIIHVCYARIQGKEALLDNFRRSCFVCDTDEFLPAVMSPPRDGSTSRTPPVAVGKRVVISLDR